jgi:hypothetical protein
MFKHQPKVLIVLGFSVKLLLIFKKKHRCYEMTEWGWPVDSQNRGTGIFSPDMLLAFYDPLFFTKLEKVTDNNQVIFLLFFLFIE